MLNMDAFSVSLSLSPFGNPPDRQVNTPRQLIHLPLCVAAARYTAASSIACQMICIKHQIAFEHRYLICPLCVHVLQQQLPQAHTITRPD